MKRIIPFFLILLFISGCSTGNTSTKEDVPYLITIITIATLQKPSPTITSSPTVKNVPTITSTPTIEELEEEIEPTPTQTPTEISEPSILVNWDTLITVDGIDLPPNDRVYQYRNEKWENGDLNLWDIGTRYGEVVISDWEVSPGVYEISVGFKLNNTLYSYKVLVAECWIANPRGDPQLFEGGGKRVGRKDSFTLRGLEQEISSDFSFEGKGPNPSACEYVWRNLKVDTSQFDKLVQFFTYGKIDPGWTIDPQGRVDLRNIVVAFTNQVH